MKIIGVIPARGGSKGIPGKNIRRLAGRPLIEWTIQAALESSLVDEVVVSTDDAKIAACALKCGASVPFMRPPELATDEASSVSVALHALTFYPDAQQVVLLQPTSPLRESVDIDYMLKHHLKSGNLSTASICPVHEHPYWMYEIDDDGRLSPLVVGREIAIPRQKFPEYYSLNGAIYISEVNHLVKLRKLVTLGTVGYIMSREKSVDIDSEQDWQLAESLLLGRLHRQRFESTKNNR
jgi:N-acylneuraminate cytidylyltransferase/CMP-N,N'-diacetyllegionaminic acid synthase